MPDPDYHTKRTLDRTPEPADGDPGTDERPVFVVQKHGASTLHYDLRLEVDGALKSWAVTKGPSLDPGDKRLAMATEEHPLGYASFEGVIPEGEYGGGPVLIWDRGRFENTTEDRGEPVPAAAALERGHLRFRLHGRKLRGGFALQRMGGGTTRWLLVKTGDTAADRERDVLAEAPRSVVSGRTLEQIAGAAAEDG